MTTSVASWQLGEVARADEGGFSERLDQAIEASGLRGVRLAERVKASEASISRWRKGLRFPGGRELAQLAAGLGVRPEWLVSGTGPREAAPADGEEDPMMVQLETWARLNMPGNGVTDEVLTSFVATHRFAGGVGSTLDDLYADLLAAARAAKKGKFRVVTEDESELRKALVAGGASDDEIEREVGELRDGSKKTR